ncbi:MAG TPA: prepilin-type N-terminal cleavage/methylation domain-containing protein [Persephonella sp.]|nr:prepilin-type N-terminal cleavage/methylation domain-containing protein [Persephonella sp.]
MMIYLSGIKTNSGFTLLEVIVAITIFAIAFTVLIKIQFHHITDIQKQIERLEALKYFKIRNLKIPGEITTDDRFKIRQETRTIDFGIKQTTYTVFDKQNRPVLEIKTYEK